MSKRKNVSKNKEYFFKRIKTAYITFDKKCGTLSRGMKQDLQTHYCHILSFNSFNNKIA